MVRLDAIETYYDTVPRAAATTEEVGPFTLFLAEEGTGWDFYARPGSAGTRPSRPTTYAGCSTGRSSSVARGRSSGSTR